MSSPIRVALYLLFSLFRPWVRPEPRKLPTFKCECPASVARPTAAKNKSPESTIRLKNPLFISKCHDDAYNAIM
jgi:hypothetical protein